MNLCLKPKTWVETSTEDKLDSMVEGLNILDTFNDQNRNPYESKFTLLDLESSQALELSEFGLRLERF